MCLVTLVVANSLQLWNVARQAPLSIGIRQAPLSIGILKNTGVGFMLFSRGSSPLEDWTHVSYISCTGRWVLNTTSTTWEAQGLSVGTRKSILRATRSTKKFPIGFVMWIPSHKSLKTPHRLLTLVVYFGIKSVSGDPLILTISIFYRVTSYLVIANL